MGKTLKTIIGILIGIAAIAIIIIVFTSLTSKKMVCTSKEESITLMYNDKTLKGYTAKGINYDFEKQKAIALDMGIDEYLIEFESWFIINTSGTCKK